MQTDNILDFLSAPKQNNTKEWMDSNKSWYQEVRKEFIEIVSYLIKGISDFDEAVISAEPKKSIFRVNRDIRFSKNKEPYKTNFGAAIAEDGRNSGNPIYYFHLEPERVFLAGGLYMPEAEPLKKIRQEIDYNPEDLKKIVDSPTFKEAFGAIQGEALKTAPKGYPKDHPNIELLRLKSYIVVHEFTEPVSTSKELFPQTLEFYKLMKPFLDYLRVAIS